MRVVFKIVHIAKDSIDRLILYLRALPEVRHRRRRIVQHLDELFSKGLGKDFLSIGIKIPFLNGFPLVGKAEEDGRLVPGDVVDHKIFQGECLGFLTLVYADVDLLEVALATLRVAKATPVRQPLLTFIDPDEVAKSLAEVGVWRESVLKD